ncbi:hypothetical protein C2845_PM02G17950 [Panicum miliaceum]|uniref:Uncharacterized protein n=1 Tax=Panicum miliaceum TaxID=4540 RepID=A0A3L6SFF3_PANMI|nr:hypothetical protein C2845_PM02G17950 [Panicum miliaceum]
MRLWLISVEPSSCCCSTGFLAFLWLTTMKMVGLASDYDLLALDSMSGNGLADTNKNIFPDVDSTWKTFREIQGLPSKTNGRVIGDVMTSSPLAVRENTNLDVATRLLLETKYRRL